MLAPALILASVALMTGCASIVRSRIYLPEPMPAGIQPWPGEKAPQEVSVRTADGLVLHGYRWPATDPALGTILFFHGNAGNRYTAARMALPLMRNGSGLIVASYRGYGDNPGRPSEDGLYKDGAAFLKLARSSAPGGKLYLFGYSLGAAVALKLAAEQEVDGVITLGAFSSLANIAPPAARGLLPDRFDSQLLLRSVREPVLLLHGTADEVVPYAEAEKLRAAGGSNVRLVSLKDAPHHISFEPLAEAVWRNIGQMPPAPGPD